MRANWTTAGFCSVLGDFISENHQLVYVNMPKLFFFVENHEISIERKAFFKATGCPFRFFCHSDWESCENFLRATLSVSKILRAFYALSGVPTSDVPFLLNKPKLTGLWPSYEWMRWRVFCLGWRSEWSSVSSRSTCHVLTLQYPRLPQLSWTWY